MSDELSERLLAKVMDWTPDRLNKERAHLHILASCKYDSYEQYRPGAKFITSLALWLRTFQQQRDKETAYNFALSRVVFLSNREMQHLVVTSYPYHIRNHIIERVARELRQPLYPTCKIVDSEKFKVAARRCLYLGLSDGARSDSFRRGNVRDISNEQIVATYQISTQKALSLLKDLRKSLGEPVDSKDAAKFNTVVFLDDFNGSGITFFRENDGQQEGKLVKIIDEINSPKSSLGSIVDREGLLILFIYYVSTEDALRNANEAIKKIDAPDWMEIKIETVQNIPSSEKISRARDPEMCVLIEGENCYDEDASKDEHLLKGGVDNARYGFAGSALPLVLSHNTPNNSIFLLWSTEDYCIRGLFPRVPRHRPE